MQRRMRFRMIVFICFIVAMMAVFALRLYKLQTAELVTADADSMTYRTTMEASRGNILDRNGNVLVSNRASYNLVIINFVLTNTGATNENLLKLLDLCDQRGIEYESHFPVTMERPYTYQMDGISSTWQDYFRAFLRNREYDLDTTASTLMKKLREDYNIPSDWTQEQAYKVISVRYELELRSVEGVGLENYTLATDVSAEDLAAVMELSIPGVIVESSTVRVYNTKYAAHLLGSIGSIEAGDWPEYRDKGYAMNAKVGKEGIELAFEEYLHGTSGMKYTTVSSTGEKLDEYYTSVPQPGNNVETTLDISLQAVAENALESLILDLRENGVGAHSEGKDAEGGAVVVQAVKTGEILACASYPTYDLSTYNRDFKELSEDPYKPLYDRALLAEYAPGSIYKMVTAIAAIDMGHIGEYYEITDEGVYMYYAKENFTPKCYVWTSSNATHGTINMQEALAESCNYYFYEAGRLTYNAYFSETGENPFDIVAKALGLGEHTGIELFEYTGQRANAETKKANYAGDESGWYGADVLQAVIGQSLNRFTPMQMVCYVQALANKGTRYSATFLSRIVSWDYQSLIKEHEPEVASTLDISDEALDCIDKGMRMTAKVGTAKNYLANYPIEVACKTGTAQWQGVTSDGSVSGSDNASFVIYAPADDPEIAIAVYVEKGAQGGNLANVCIPIMDAYFSGETKYETILTENTVH